jgi:hypothetical protein
MPHNRFTHQGKFRTKSFVIHPLGWKEPSLCQQDKHFNPSKTTQESEVEQDEWTGDGEFNIVNIKYISSNDDVVHGRVLYTSRDYHCA